MVGRYIELLVHLSFWSPPPPPPLPTLPTLKTPLIGRILGYELTIGRCFWLSYFRNARSASTSHTTGTTSALEGVGTEFDPRARRAFILILRRANERMNVERTNVERDSKQVHQLNRKRSRVRRKKNRRKEVVVDETNVVGEARRALGLTFEPVERAIRRKKKPGSKNRSHASTAMAATLSVTTN